MLILEIVLAARAARWGGPADYWRTIGITVVLNIVAIASTVSMRARGLESRVDRVAVSVIIAAFGCISLANAWFVWLKTVDGYDLDPRYPETIHPSKVPIWP